MAKVNDSALEEKNKRIGLTLGTELNKRFMALAEFDRKKPATLATEIIKAYMDSRADDIQSILQAKEDYEKSIDEIRNKHNADVVSKRKKNSAPSDVVPAKSVKK